MRELFAKYPAGTMVGNFWKDVAFIGFHALEETMDWRTIDGNYITLGPESAITIVPEWPANGSSVTSQYVNLFVVDYQTCQNLSK